MLRPIPRHSKSKRPYTEGSGRKKHPREAMKARAAPKAVTQRAEAGRDRGHQKQFSRRPTGRFFKQCGAITTLSRFLYSATLGSGLLGRMPDVFNYWGLIMIIGDLTLSKQTKAIKAAFTTNDVRTLIANQLGVSVARVTDDAHFTDDLGADWLDRLDLM